MPAQNYLPVIHRFNLEDGLPHRQVNCILEDRRGFIWVATNGGVARFDGLRFKIFNKADNGLSTDLVHWILEDAAGNLWLISRANAISVLGIASVDILDPVSGRITPFDQYIKEKPPVPLENLNNRGICIPSNHPGLKKLFHDQAFRQEIIQKVQENYLTTRSSIMKMEARRN